MVEKRPNFIIIHTDQQRYDCIAGHHRRPALYTPYLDSIANIGADFSSCYAGCPVCIPQRRTLLTGQTALHHGLFTNTAIPYLPADTTLPTEMRKGGYQTAMVGRTMHTYPFGYSYGFEYYHPGDPSSDEKEHGDYFFRYLREHTGSETGGYNGAGMHNNSRAAGPFHLPDDCHQTKWATNEALEFLNVRDKSRPFMLFVGFYAPHSPHNPPAEYFNRYLNRQDLGEPAIADYDVPPVNSGDTLSPYVNIQGEDMHSLLAGYYGNITFLDMQIGRILEHTRMLPNTYTIFTSDHGDMLGDHYMYQKTRPYEGSCHIPLMIYGPGIPEGLVINEPVGWEDLMPTILDLAGLNIPASVDGKSLATLLAGKKDPKWRPYMHGECISGMFRSSKIRPQSDKINLFDEKGAQFLTDGTMKYIWHITTGTEQLFNVRTDWNEQHDLSKDPAYQEELKKWRSRLIKELTGRKEGYSDGTKLIAGKTPMIVTEEVAAIRKQRAQEGFKFAYSVNGTEPVDAMEYKDKFM